MRYLSVCSGIEAASVAWEPLGFQPAAFAEIEPFPSAVLKHHYPSIPNLGDMSNFKEWPHDLSIDALVGGTPCQSFSVAGLRKGLDDPRGNLMLTYLAIAERFRPRWIVWENVPGVLSSAGGRDFGTFLGALGQLGYGWAYRVLDAQWFGVAQRRRRVFVVGCLGDPASAAAVLFERESVRRDPAPSRKTGQSVAGTLGGSSQSGGFRTTDLDNNGAFIPVQSFAIQERAEADNIRSGPGGKGYRAEVGYTLEARTRTQAVAVAPTLGGCSNGGGANGPGRDVDSCESLILVQPFEVANCLTQRMHKGINTTVDEGQTPGLEFAPRPDVAHTSRGEGFDAGEDGSGRGVRRLTPVECERLQGFPDDYTAIAWRGKPAEDCPDGPRYKALGNSMAVPVMRWIGERIKRVDETGSAVEKGIDL